MKAFMLSITLIFSACSTGLHKSHNKGVYIKITFDDRPSKANQQKRAFQQKI